MRTMRTMNTKGSGARSKMMNAHGTAAHPVAGRERGPRRRGNSRSRVGNTVNPESFGPHFTVSGMEQSPRPVTANRRSKDLDPVAPTGMG
jgi:hypothetical protein